MTDVLIAVTDGAQVRSYHRGADGALTQVAQFLTAAALDPAELATIVADLGDRFGWAEGPPPQVRSAQRLPASPTRERAASAPARTKRHATHEETAADRAAIIAYIAAHPGCSRTEIADHLWPDDSHSVTHARITYRLKPILERLVITPGTGTSPDRLRLRNGDG